MPFRIVSYVYHTVYRVAYNMRCVNGEFAHMKCTITNVIRNAFRMCTICMAHIYSYINAFMQIDYGISSSNKFIINIYLFIFVWLCVFIYYYIKSYVALVADHPSLQLMSFCLFTICIVHRQHISA